MTGFVLGGFSEPAKLTMRAKVTLKNIEMRRKFVAALKRTGYSSDEIRVDGQSVYILFKRPHSPQPITRTAVTDAVIQEGNKALCDLYQQVAGDFENTLDKIKYIKKHDPKIYNAIMQMGRSKQLYAGYKKLKKKA